MKKERVQYHIDSFTDENQDYREFVICAISEVLSEECRAYISNEDYLYNEEEIVKGVKLGWAICNPKDKSDIDLGMKIALGRARKNESYALYATQLGYINSKMIEAFLEQESEFFKKNPQSHIAGYKRKK